MFNFISCCSNSKNTFSDFFKCSCTQNKLKNVNCVVFQKIPLNVDYNNILNGGKDSLHIVFNHRKQIISVSDNNIINKSMKSIINKSLNSLIKYMSPPIVKMIGDIIDGVEQEKDKIGCLLYLNETPYLLIAFPITKNNNELIGFLFTKKIFDDSLLKHHDILQIPRTTSHNTIVLNYPKTPSNSEDEK